MITDHVWRPKTNVPRGQRTGLCVYAGCGQPAQAHQRHARGRKATDDSGPGRVHPVGERGAGEHDPGRDTPGGTP